MTTGPDLTLGPQVALSFSLVLHEMKLRTSFAGLEGKDASIFGNSLLASVTEWRSARGFPFSCRSAALSCLAH